MKRLDTFEASLRSAGRYEMLLSGGAENADGIDPSLIPHTPWPISPHLLQTLEMAINEAIAAGLTVRDSVERVVQVFADFGIFLSCDDIVAIITKGMQPGVSTS